MMGMHVVKSNFLEENEEKIEWEKMRKNANCIIMQYHIKLKQMPIRVRELSQANFVIKILLYQF